MSARRVELVHGAQRRSLCQPRLEVHALGIVLWTQQLQQPEEAVRIAFERRRAEQQDVAAQRRNRSDGSPRRLTRVARRPAQPLRLVYDQQIDARAHRLLGQLRALDQHLQRNHPAPVHVEGVEAFAEVALHVGQPRRVEQREHLVVLAPQLAQPLHGQRVGRHHQAALHAAGVHQPVENQRRFDGFPEAHFVGQQPPHRFGGAGAFGDVQLVGEQPYASAQERTQAVGFAKRQQVQDVEPRQKIAELVHVSQQQALEQGALERDRPQRVGWHGLPIRQAYGAVGQPRRNRGFLARSRDPHGAAQAEIHGCQRCRVGPEAQGRPRMRELRHHHAAVERGDAADAQFGVEAVSQEIAGSPCARSAPRRHSPVRTGRR